MSRIFSILHNLASADPQRIALQDGIDELTYVAMESAVKKTAVTLAKANITVLGLLADNGIPWVLSDLAALHAELPCVPLPLFFSPQQILHAINDSWMSGLLTDRPMQMLTLLAKAGIPARFTGEVNGLHLLQLDQATRAVSLPQGTAKITYTSGTTGDPKGVCLSREHMETVAMALQEASEASARDRHLCLTPLSTLLENIGGVYVPLLAGACCCAPSLRTVGLAGASGLDSASMVRSLHNFDASTAILAPQMLHALVGMIAGGAVRPRNLRFVAVGGAPVSPYLLEQAAELGIPVFEGYGLSECASVVTLNTPHHNRPGSTGRPLPHVAISFAYDGEILLNNPVFLGYLGQDRPMQPWPTGDLGYLDADGYLHLSGRKKSLFITSFGRNVAPEWVERELTQQPAIFQAAVFGEAKPWNCAVIVPGHQHDEADIEQAVAQANLRLPDYARVGRWVIAHAPFAAANGQSTANGRLCRRVIQAEYFDEMELLYQEEMHAVL
jgi:long-chain acyl-CoA synthetase